MKRSRWMPLIIVLIGVSIVLHVIILFWLKNEWNEFLNNNDPKPGRDTTVFWHENEEGFVYQIAGGEDYVFFMDNTIDSESYYPEIKNVHFYANTSEYIFIITSNNEYYCINKKTGIISTSLPFDTITSNEEQLCFINLQYKKGFNIMKEY